MWSGGFPEWLPTPESDSRWEFRGFSGLPGRARSAIVQRKQQWTLCLAQQYRHRARNEGWRGQQLPFLDRGPWRWMRKERVLTLSLFRAARQLSPSVEEPTHIVSPDGVEVFELLEGLHLSETAIHK